MKEKWVMVFVAGLILGIFSAYFCYALPTPPASPNIDSPVNMSSDMPSYQFGTSLDENMTKNAANNAEIPFIAKIAIAILIIIVVMLIVHYSIRKFPGIRGK